MSYLSLDKLPDGPNIKGKLSRDDVIMRLGMAVIALYLIVTLAFPLWAMLSKSFSTFQFDLGAYELQVSDEEGRYSGEILTPAHLNAELRVLSDNDLIAGSDSRMGLTQFFPDFSFRSPVMYQIRNIHPPTGRFLVGSELKTGSTDWLELDSNTFRRVQLQAGEKATGSGELHQLFLDPCAVQFDQEFDWSLR